jgi:hypothetical protein
MIIAKALITFMVQLQAVCVLNYSDMSHDFVIINYCYTVQYTILTVIILEQTESDNTNQMIKISNLLVMQPSVLSVNLGHLITLTE